ENATIQIDRFETLRSAGRALTRRGLRLREIDRWVRRSRERVHELFGWMKRRWDRKERSWSNAMWPTKRTNLVRQRAERRRCAFTSRRSSSLTDPLGHVWVVPEPRISGTVDGPRDISPTVRHSGRYPGASTHQAHAQPASASGNAMKHMCQVCLPGTRMTASGPGSADRYRR